MNEINSIPKLWNEKEKDKLLGSLFPQEFTNIRNKSYKSIRTSKTFDEISYEINYGENNSCGEYVDQWYSKGINANELLKFIHDKIPFGSSFFYPQMFITSTLNPANQNSPLLFMGITAYNALSDDKLTFRYDDVKNKILNQGDVYVKLNMRACHVNLSEPGFIFKIDASKNELSFTASYVYQDAIDNGIRNFSNNTPETNDYDEIDKKYYAMILECKDANSFMGLSYFIEHQTFIKDSVIKTFSKAIKKATTKQELKFLYENIPDFALRELKFTEELLWSHLIELTNYDDVGVFSGWVDGSSALINVLKAFGNSVSLYETFKKNPAFIKRLYQNLDGKSVFDKQFISNKLIFSNLITALCINNGFKGLQHVGKTFKYGKEYKFDGDVNQWITNEKQDEFFLQQLRNIPFLGADIIPIEDQIPEDSGAMYHPLDLVSIIDTDSKDKTPIVVPALYIKALSDEIELQEIETNIRIGLDILAIVLGLITVASTSNPAILALAFADIGLATIDGGIQAYKTEILKFEGGAEFLETWEKIYVVGGLAVAGPALIQTVLTTGAKVLRLAQMAKNANGAHFIKTCLLKVLLEVEIANFTKNTVKILDQETELITVTRGVLNEFKVGKLYEKGLFVVTGEVKNGDKIEQQIALIYKGEVIIKANQSNFSKASYQLLKNLANEKRFIEECEKIINRRRIVSVKDVSLVGMSPIKGVKMIIGLIDEFGNNIGSFARLPNGKELIYKLILNGKEVDINCKLKVIDSSFGRTYKVPVLEGENLLFADFNIPKSITDNISRLGIVLLDDGLAYFNRSKKYANIDGTLNVWNKSESYAEYGGQSINLDQFWKARDIGKSVKEAALETFSGKWAKKNEFTKVRFNEDDIKKNRVVLNFLK